jgi:hypothetical protein
MQKLGLTISILPAGRVFSDRVTQQQLNYFFYFFAEPAKEPIRCVR